MAYDYNKANAILKAYDLPAMMTNTRKFIKPEAEKIWARNGEALDAEITSDPVAFATMGVGVCHPYFGSESCLSLRIGGPFSAGVNFYQVFSGVSLGVIWSKRRITLKTGDKVRLMRARSILFMTRDRMRYYTRVLVEPNRINAVHELSAWLEDHGFFPVEEGYGKFVAGNCCATYPRPYIDCGEIEESKAKDGKPIYRIKLFEPEVSRLEDFAAGDDIISGV